MCFQFLFFFVLSAAFWINDSLIAMWEFAKLDKKEMGNMTELIGLLHFFFLNGIFLPIPIIKL